jgi:hypothetical protein
LTDGEVLLPSQVKRVGSVPPAVIAGLEIVIAEAAAGWPPSPAAAAANAKQASARPLRSGVIFRSSIMLMQASR